MSRSDAESGGRAERMATGSGPYVPTTEDIRNAWWRDQCPAADLDFDDTWGQAFDRWLEQHDREIKARAVVAFGAVYLPLELFQRAREYADRILKGENDG
jgi:hypothetical protein